VQRVVEVVVPLRIEATRAEQVRLVGLVFQDEMHLAVGDRHAYVAGEGGQPIGMADRVHRVQAQAVEAVFLQPVQRVVQEEVADRLQPDVDRRAPGRVRAIVAEKGRCVLTEIIAVRPEMVVDDVEDEHEAETVRGIDQRLQFIGRAVGRRRRVGQHAVVAPVAGARKLRDRHQLDRGDAELAQPGQRLAHPIEAAEQAHVQFVDHRLAPRPAAPLGMLPGIGDRIDHDARPVHVTTGLQPRGRVRHQEIGPHPVAVAGAGRRPVTAGMPAFADRLHRHPLAAVEFELDLGDVRRP